MSLALWFWRIWFQGSRGSVVRARKREELLEAPHIDGIDDDITEIDYAPGVCCLIRHGQSRLMEMSPAEIAACNRFLGWPGPIRLEVL